MGLGHEWCATMVGEFEVADATPRLPEMPNTAPNIVHKVESRIGINSVVSALSTTMSLCNDRRFFAHGSQRTSQAQGFKERGLNMNSSS